MLKIRVKRAFHPAPASRGFASHVFLVYWVFPRLPFAIVAYAFTLFWTNFAETAVCLYVYIFEGVRTKYDDVRLSGVVWSKICIHRKKYACMIKFQLQCSRSPSIFTGYRTISPESFSFLLEIFFVKDCIEEITRFVAAVK